MDCNGCVQKIKKALYGINGEPKEKKQKKESIFFIHFFLSFFPYFLLLLEFSCSFAGIYDIYIDFPQQKLTIIGWAEPERIMKAIKKTRKIATICSDSEQTDPQAAPTGQPPDYMAPGSGEPPNISSGPPPDIAVGGGPPDMAMGGGPPPGQMVVQDGSFDPTNGPQPPPPGGYDSGQGHVSHQPSDHGHIVQQYPSESGHVVHHQGPGPELGHVISHQPEYSHVVHHQPTESFHVGHQPSEHVHMVNQPPDYSHTVHHQQPPDHSQTVQYHQPPNYSQSHVVQHHQPEYRYASSHNYHHNIPGATSMQPATVIHSYNTYKPSPYITEYVRPLTCSRPPVYASESIPQQPTTHYSPRMDLYNYNEDYYNTGTGSSNGNITSIFSDENPNACNLM